MQPKISTVCLCSERNSGSTWLDGLLEVMHRHDEMPLKDSETLQHPHTSVKILQQAFIGNHTTYRGESEPCGLSSLRPPHHHMCLCSICRPTLSLAAKRGGTRNALTSMTIT